MGSSNTENNRNGCSTLNGGFVPPSMYSNESVKASGEDAQCRGSWYHSSRNNEYNLGTNSIKKSTVVNHVNDSERILFSTDNNKKKQLMPKTAHTKEARVLVTSKIEQRGYREPKETMKDESRQLQQKCVEEITDAKGSYEGSVSNNFDFIKKQKSLPKPQTNPSEAKSNDCNVKVTEVHVSSSVDLGKEQEFSLIPETDRKEEAKFGSKKSGFNSVQQYCQPKEISNADCSDSSMKGMATFRCFDMAGATPDLTESSVISRFSKYRIG